MEGEEGRGILQCYLQEQPTQGCPQHLAGNSFEQNSGLNTDRYGKERQFLVHNTRQNTCAVKHFSDEKGKVEER